MAGKATVAIAVVANAAKARSELDKTAKTADGMGKKLGKVGSALNKAALIGAAAGVAAIGVATKVGIEGAIGYDKALRQSSAALKANKHAGDLTLQSMRDRAAAIETASGATIDENESLAAQNALLRVGVSSSKAMDAALQASADLATARGTSIQSSSTMISKALADPTKAAGKLSKVGVQLSESQQQQIEAFTKAGQTAKAQGVILGAIEGKYKGAAAAAGDTLAGKVGVLKDTFEDTARDIAMKAIPTLTNLADKAGKYLPPLMEKAGEVIGRVRDALGQIWSKVQPLLPSTQQLGSAWRTLTGILGNPVFQAVAAAVAAVVVSLQVYSGVMAVVRTATAAWAAVQAALNVVLTANPIGIVVLAIAGLVAALVVAYKRSETFRRIVDGAWRGIKAAISSVVSWFRDNAWPIIRVVLGLIGAYYKTLWTIAKTVFSGVRTAIGWAISAVVSLKDKAVSTWSAITSAFGKIKAGAAEKFVALRDWVKGIPGKIKAALGDLGSLLKDAGKALMRGLLDGITEGWHWVQDKVGGMGSWIKDHKGPLSYDKVLLKPAGKAIMAGLRDGLAEGMPSVEQYLSQVTRTIAGTSIAAPTIAPTAYGSDVSLRAAGSPTVGVIRIEGEPRTSEGKQIVDALREYTRTMGPIRGVVIA